MIICIPQLAGQCYILGENLFDFLCLGKDWGYFRLEQLGYDLEATLDLYTSRSRKDADTPSDSDRDEEHQQAILKSIPLAVSAYGLGGMSRDSIRSKIDTSRAWSSRPAERWLQGTDEIVRGASGDP